MLVPAKHDVHDFELDHCEEKEKEWRVTEEVKVDIKEEIKKAMKELQCVPDISGLSYEDLCIHPNFNLLERFKIPMFDTFHKDSNSLWLI